MHVTLRHYSQKEHVR